MTTRWSIETVVVTTLPGCGLRLTTRLTRERRPASSPDASGWSSRMLTRGRKLALLPTSSAVVLDTSAVWRGEALARCMRDGRPAAQWRRRSHSPPPSVRVAEAETAPRAAQARPCQRGRAGSSFVFPQRGGDVRVFCWL